MCHRFWWHICFFSTAQANAKKAKGPLSNRTKKAVDKDKQATTKKNNEGITRVWQKWRVQWLIQHSTSHQLLCYVDSFELRNPLLRKAAKRGVS
jgi:hypothetical protein